MLGHVLQTSVAAAVDLDQLTDTWPPLPRLMELGAPGCFRYPQPGLDHQVP